MNPTKQGLKHMDGQDVAYVNPVLAHESNKTRIETTVYCRHRKTNYRVLAHESNKTRIETGLQGSGQGRPAGVLAHESNKTRIETGPRYTYQSITELS